jgi:hypothetical protein
MTNTRDTHFLKVVDGDFWQHRAIDAIVAEYIRELAQAETSKPIRDVHRCTQFT